MSIKVFYKIRDRAIVAKLTCRNQRIGENNRSMYLSLYCRLQHQKDSQCLQ